MTYLLETVTSAAALWVAFTIISIILVIIADTSCHFWKILLNITLISLAWPFIWKLSLPQLIISIVAYVVLGSMFSLFKWSKHVRNKIEEFSTFFRENGIKSAKDLIDAGRKADHYSEMRQAANQFNPVQQKDRIIGWIAYWPWSLLKMMTADIGETIFQALRTMYWNIVDHYIVKTFKM